MDHFYKQIVAFQHKVDDHIDDPRSSAGQALRRAVQKLEDDSQSRKNPRSIEDQVKHVIHALEAAGEERAMSHGHVDELIDHCNEFIQELRKMRS